MGLGVGNGAVRTSDRVLLVHADALATIRPKLDQADVAQHGSVEHALHA